MLMKDPTRLIVNTRIAGSMRATDSLRSVADAIALAAEAVVACLRAGGTVYTCGNGGSAAEAMHLSEELIGRYRSNRRALRAVCLNADPAALTCIANDFGFDLVFARQCEALVSKGDVLVVFSTSGNSRNIVEAAKAARRCGGVVVGLLGKGGGACRALCDHAIVVESDDAGHVQEAHQVVLHILCEAAERAFG
jgi:D-sedoheptulose 7-phosphate isomerase